MTARIRRLGVAIALTAGALALPLAAAAPAAADEADCADSFLATGGYQLFQVDQRYVPPPLRGTGWDCASRIADRPVVSASGSAQYSLLWIGISASDAIAILDRFEEYHWTDGDATIAAQNADDRSVNQPMRPRELLDWDPLPSSITSRFSNGATGEDIIEFDYGDGVGVVLDPAIDASMLRIDVFARAPYQATGFGDPSVLSSLRTIAEALPSGAQLGVLGGTAVILMLIVGFPGYLLNKVLEKHWSGFLGWLRGLRARRVSREARGTPEQAQAKAAKAAKAEAKADAKAQKQAAKRAAQAPPGSPAPTPRTRRPRPSWLVWPGFVAAAIIAGFIDPAYGFNPMSLRLLITALVSFALLNVLGWFVVIGVFRRIQPDAKPTITFRWSSLIVVALTVLIARLLQFEPGIVFGLVAGLTFAITLVASRDALVILLGSSTALVIALLAWIGYSAFAPISRALPGNFFFVGITETFSGLTVEGISTLPLALLPLLALDGAVLFAWRKWVWAIAYTIGAAAFVFVMFTIPESWKQLNGGYGRWLLLFLAFAVIAVGVWVIEVVVERRAKAVAAAATTAPGEAPAAATPAAETPAAETPPTIPPTPPPPAG